MSNRKVKKVEGGHKKGHSNMCHWMGTEEIKAAAKVVRRQQDKRLERVILDYISGKEI